MKKYRLLNKIFYSDSRTIKEFQLDKIKQLLIYSDNNVPYYSKVLRECGVINGKDKVCLENFSSIPFLTKDIIRDNFSELQSTTRLKGEYRDTSGGSTGEPVQFIHSKLYWEWSMANKFLFDKFIGKDIGELELRVWGSPSDLAGTESLKSKLNMFLHNQKMFNAYCITEQSILQLIHLFNKLKPTFVKFYVETAYEIAKLIEAHSIPVHHPLVLSSCAGTLHDWSRKKISEQFQTRVRNNYGSREVGDIAIECSEHNLHISDMTQLVEIIKENGEPAEEGETGEIVITLLTEYSMPLIRYKIGDMAIRGANCPCGNCSSTFKHVIGRNSDNFYSKSKGIIYGEYFNVLFYHKSWIRKFQIIQNDYQDLTLKVELKESRIPPSDKTNIENACKFVLGDETIIHWVIMDSIPPTPSGKYRYTISNVTR